MFKMGSLKGYRKIVLGLLILAVGIAVDATFGLSSNLLYLIITVAGGFFLGNVGEHVCDTLKVSSKDKAVASSGVPVQNVTNVVTAIEARLNDIQSAENALQSQVTQLAQVSQSNLEAVNAILGVMKASRGQL